MEAPPANKFDAELAPGCGRYLVLGAAALMVLVVAGDTGLPLLAIGAVLLWAGRQIHRQGTPFADGVPVTGTVTDVTATRRRTGGLRFPAEARMLYGGHVTYRDPIVGESRTLEPRSYRRGRRKPVMGDTVELSVSASDHNRVRIIEGPTVPLIFYGLGSGAIVGGLVELFGVLAPG